MRAIRGATHRAHKCVRVLLLVIALAACGQSGPTRSAASLPPTAAVTPPVGVVRLSNGRGIEIACAGNHGSVVILEAGLGNTLAEWSNVMPGLSSDHIVCAYNRAGIGRSDPRPLPHGAAAAADDLRSLVQAARLSPPYTVVGASYGGLIAQLFASRYAQLVTGVVLVDSLTAQWDAKLERMLPAAEVAARRAIPNGEPVTNDEIRSSELATASESFPPVPLVVLRHGIPFPGDSEWPTAKVEGLWQAEQTGLASLSPKAVVLVATTSGHRIAEEQPDLVVAAIRSIADPGRWPPTAPAERPPFGLGAHLAGGVPGTVVFSTGHALVQSHADGSSPMTIKTLPGAMLTNPSIDNRGNIVGYIRRSGTGPDATSEAWVATANRRDRRVAQGVDGVSVSPDGSTLAYTSRGRSYVTSLSGAVSPTDLGAIACSTWSPGGDYLACDDPDDHLLLVKVSTGEHVEPAVGGPPNWPGAWSPDGSVLAFTSARDGNGDVFLFDLARHAERRLTDGPGNQAVDAWTSAGLIVTSSLPGADASDWFLVDASTGTVAALPGLRGATEPLAYRP